MTTSVTFFNPSEDIYSHMSLSSQVGTFTHNMVRGRRFATNSFLDDITILGENYLAVQLMQLKKEIGSVLFNQLTISDKLFMIETAGSIDFRKAIDLDEIAENIASYDHSSREE